MLHEGDKFSHMDLQPFPDLLVEERSRRIAHLVGARHIERSTKPGPRARAIPRVLTDAPSTATGLPSVQRVLEHARNTIPQRTSASTPPTPRTDGASLLPRYAPLCLCTDERGVDEVLSEKPRLEFASANDVRDEGVIGAVIAKCGDVGRRIVRVAEDHLVRLEQPRQHCRYLLAAIRGPRYLGDLRHVPRVTDRNPPEGLHPLGNFVHQATAAKYCASGATALVGKRSSTSR